MPTPGTYPSLYDRIMARVIKTPTCWIWPGAKVGGVYGTAAENNRQILIHRYLYERENGPIPEGKEAGHRCPGGPRPDCVNPAHIEAITHSENCLDKYQGMCLRGLHDLNDPAIGIRSSNGKRTCRPCKQTQQRLWRERRAAGSRS